MSGWDVLLPLSYRLARALKKAVALTASGGYNYTNKSNYELREFAETKHSGYMAKTEFEVEQIITPVDRLETAMPPIEAPRGPSPFTYPSSLPPLRDLVFPRLSGLRDRAISPLERP